MFCGIKCENPFFLASSAVCTNYAMVAKAFDAGWAGVFYKTICLQEIKEVSGQRTIIYPKFDKELCVGCGRCEISCNDGGHQAIVFDKETRRPRLIGTKCVGCHLCRLVCPTGAIGVTKRIEKKNNK